MNEAIDVLRDKLLKDIAKSEELVVLMRTGKIETFSVDAGGKRTNTTDGSIGLQERIIENLKATIDYIDR